MPMGAGVIEKKHKGMKVLSEVLYLDRQMHTIFNIVKSYSLKPVLF